MLAYIIYTSIILSIFFCMKPKIRERCENECNNIKNKYGDDCPQCGCCRSQWVLSVSLLNFIKYAAIIL